MTAYLMPLLVVPEPTAGDLIAYLTIMLVIAVVYVRSRMIQLNPLLYVLGYRLYAITTEDGFRGYLIDTNSPRVGEQLRVGRREDILLALRKT